MSQCPHCRGLRKARAQHVKCDCADKNHNKSDCKKDHTKGLHSCSCHLNRSDIYQEAAPLAAVPMEADVLVR